MSTSTDTTPKAPEAAEPSGVSRRGFLGGAGMTAAGVAAGAVSLGSLANAEPAAAAVTSVSADATPNPAGAARQTKSWRVRREAADFWKRQGIVAHPTNGDEQRYESRIGNYSKGLPHNSLGEVNKANYDSMLKALTTGNVDDFDNMLITPGGRKQTSPQCGLAFDMEGIDAQAVAVPPPPALASKEQAAEMVEHYWQALLRDVNFLDYNGSPIAQAAAADLNQFGADFKGPKVGGRVTTQTLFRDIAPGTTVGPYISQFMWLNTPFGVEQVDRKMWTKSPVDHMQSFDQWLASQNGMVLESPSFLGERRYLVNGRDLSEWVHIDVLFQAYFNAALILMTPPDNSDNGGGIGCPFNSGNPYNDNPTQNGFCTFGPPAAMALMCETATRCLKATWHKKFQVHRRLRPEAHAGRIEVHVNQSPGRYEGALHPSTFSATVLDQIESHNNGSLLLPMAFPEGSPTHPSYTAGHATVAGASITILKALFETENRFIEHPVVPTADGSGLVPFNGPALTIEGELNKLASNIATGRNIAGVHWRSDAYASMRLGQAVAISILRDQKVVHNEAGTIFYNFRGFDGERITV